MKLDTWRGAQRVTGQVCTRQRQEKQCQQWRQVELVSQVAAVTALRMQPFLRVHTFFCTRNFLGKEQRCTQRGGLSSPTSNLMLLAATRSVARQLRTSKHALQHHARQSSPYSAAAAGLPFATVDAFAAGANAPVPYTGNPAAVCLLPISAKPIHGPDARQFDDWMRSVAMEANYSETAFLRPTGVPNEFELRWWTPTIEVDLCGHATIASSHSLWNVFGAANPAQTLRFQTLSGEVAARRSGHNAPILLDFPEQKWHEDVARDHPDFVTAVKGLGLSPHQILAAKRNRIDVLLQLDSAQTLESLPQIVDFATLARVQQCRVLIVTALEDSESARAGNSEHRSDFVSRFFAPAFGVDEDPVCGSAHCFLGPYVKEPAAMWHTQQAHGNPGGSVAVQNFLLVLLEITLLAVCEPCA